MAKTDAVVRVGLLGLGTVGTGVADILARHNDLIFARNGVRLKLVRAFVRSPKKKRHGAAAKVDVTTRPDDVVLAPDIDVVCELLGGLSPAQELMERALVAGKPVVTANKAVLAKAGPSLFAKAEKHGAEIYFEGAVAGGLPIIRTLREGLSADRITQVLGILNGTTNFILGRLEAGATYDAALAEAQALGFAEADPTMDVSGRDAADKLTILLMLAFGLRVGKRGVATVGVQALTPQILTDADALGYRVKLIASGTRLDKKHIDARVGPTLVPIAHPLSTVSGPFNAVALTSDALGTSYYQGPGAGGLPTGSAVLADLIEAARNVRAGIKGRILGMRAHDGIALAEPGSSLAPYYMRLLVTDRPGVLASVTQVLAEHEVSLATVLQRERGADHSAKVPIVMTTHPTTDLAMQRVCKAVGKLRALGVPPVALRMLEG